MANTDTDTLSLKIDIRLGQSVKNLDKLKDTLKELVPVMKKFNKEIQPLVDSLTSLGAVGKLSQSLKGLSKTMDKERKIAEELAKASQEKTPDVDEKPEKRIEPVNTKTYQTQFAPDTSWSMNEFPVIKMLQSLSSFVDKAKVSIRDFLATLKDKAIVPFGDKIKSLVGDFARIVKYRAIRNVIKNITEGFTVGVQNLAMYNKEGEGLRKTMSDLSSSLMVLKNSIGVAVAPIIAEFVPMIQKAVEVVNRVSSWISRTSAALNGQKTYIKANSKYWEDYAKSLNKAKNSLMGFDEINRLSGSDTDYGEMFTTEKVDYDLVADDFGLTSGDEFLSKIEEIKKAVESLINDAFWLLGGIFLACGNLPLAAGCLALAVRGTVKEISESNWLEKTLADQVATVFELLGGSLLVIGAILTFASHPMIGIPLMAIGAAALISSQLIRWGEVSDKVSSVCAKLSLIISGVAEVVGFLLVLFDPDPIGKGLGLALMVAGLVGIYGTVGFNWGDAIVEKVKSICNTIKQVLATVFNTVIDFFNEKFHLNIDHVTWGQNDTTLPETTVPTTEPTVSTVNTVPTSTMDTNGTIELSESSINEIKDAIVRGQEVPIQNNITLDGEPIYKSVVGYNRANVVRTGTNPLLGT